MTSFSHYNMLPDPQFDFIFIHLYICFFLLLFLRLGNCVTIYISLKVHCGASQRVSNRTRLPRWHRALKYGTNPNKVTRTISCDFQTSKHGRFSQGSPSNWHCCVKLWHNSNKVKRNVFLLFIFCVCKADVGFAHFVSELQIYSTGEDRR